MVDGEKGTAEQKEQIPFQRKLTGQKAVLVYLFTGVFILALIFNYVTFFGILRENLNMNSVGLLCGSDGCVIEDGLLPVIVIPGGPADLAGVETGDKLLVISEAVPDDVGGLDICDDGVGPIIDGCRDGLGRYSSIDDAEEVFVEPAAYGYVVGDEVTLLFEREEGPEELTITTDFALNDELVHMFTGLGVGAKGRVRVILGFDLLTMVLSFSLGVFLISRRPKDAMALYMGVLIMIIGFTATRTSEVSTATLVGTTRSITHLMSVLTAIAFYPFFYLFPTGKFIGDKSKLTGFLYGPTFVIVYSLWLILARLDPIPGLELRNASTLMIVFELLLYLIALSSQIVRYWVYASKEEKQQTKWVIGTFMLIILLFTAIVVATLLIPDLDYRSGSGANIGFAFVSITTFIEGIIRFLLLVTFSIVITKYRLWDIDFLINRSVTYGVLSVFLLLIFFGIVSGLQFLIAAIMGLSQSPTVAIILATIVVTIAFDPARIRLRRLIDTTFYGIELDYNNALRQYEANKKTLLTSQQKRSDFASYTDLELIGRGGMGEIYRAKDSVNDRIIAIKLLPWYMANDEEARRRFEREAQATTILDHEGIVRVYDIDEAEGILYMVMDYIPGDDLAVHLKANKQLTPDVTYRYLSDIASALDYAHQQDVIHRDIKPSNIMISEEGAENRAILMDFGVAYMGQRKTKITKTGMMLGTLDYIAPEQIYGIEKIDHRVDIYSMGVMAYELLTGMLPFDYANPGALVMAHMNQPPTDPGNFNTAISAKASAAIIKALSKDPDDRFDTAAEFVAALKS